MLRKLIAVALLALAAPAGAQTVGLHLASVHSRPGFNNVNPGVYVRHDNGLTLGTYYNSMRRVSVYGGMTWEAGDTLSAALTVGAVTGYGNVMPLAIPSAALRVTPSIAVRIAFVPHPPLPGAASALHLMVETKL